MRYARVLMIAAAAGLAASAAAAQEIRIFGSGPDDQGAAVSGVLIAEDGGQAIDDSPLRVEIRDAPEGMRLIPMPGVPAEPPRKVKVTYLGVATSPAAETLVEQLGLPAGTGLVVDFVDPGSPAAKAGLRKHDLLVKLADQILVNQPQMAVLVRTYKPGDKVVLTLMREAKPQQVEATLTEKEMVVAAEGARAFWMGLPPQAKDPQALAALLAMVQPEGGGDAFAAAATMTMSDGEHTLNITTHEGGRFLVAKDSDGKVVFEGPIQTEEQRKAVPPEILAKLEKMEQAVPPAPPVGAMPWFIRQIPPPQGRAPAADAATAEVAIHDGEHDLKISTRGGKRHLVAKDSGGKVLFEGPIDTEEQLKAVPEPIRKKVSTIRVSVTVSGEGGPIAPPPAPPATTPSQAP